MRIIVIILLISFKCIAQEKNINEQLNNLSQEAINKYFFIGLSKWKYFSWNKDENSSLYGISVYEFVSFKYKIKSDKLTDEDKLNGIEWIGNIIITAKSMRTGYKCGENSDVECKDIWLPWQKFVNKPLRIILTKKNNKWKYSEVIADYPWIRTPAGKTSPDCTSIKKILEELKTIN